MYLWAMAEREPESLKTEYYAIGKFPGSKRILGIGPRRESSASLTAVREPIPWESRTEADDGFTWKGILKVDSKELRGEIVFERNAAGQEFMKYHDLIGYLRDKYHITYLKATGDPSFYVGG